MPRVWMCVADDVPPRLHSLDLIPPMVSTFFCPISIPVATETSSTAEFSQAGVDIVPVYGLGHTQLFSMLDKSSALGSFLMRMSRRLKAWNIGGWKSVQISGRFGNIELESQSEDFDV